MVFLSLLRHDGRQNGASLRGLEQLKAIGRRIRGHSEDDAEAAMAETIRQADAARDGLDPARAVVLYRLVLDRWGPSFDVLVQCGNALKDSGSYDQAEQTYKAALEIQPFDADCHLQMGHLMKLANKPTEALKFYKISNQLDPFLPGPIHELRMAMCEIVSPCAERSLVPADAIANRSSRAILIRERFVKNLALRRG